METLRQNFLPTIAEAGSDTVMTHRLQVIKNTNPIINDTNQSNIPVHVHQN